MNIEVLAADPGHGERIRRLLEAAAPGRRVFCRSPCPTDLDDLCATGLPPDVLVLDSASGGMLDALERLNPERRGIDTIVLCDDASPDFLMRAMRAGVREVIPASSWSALLPGAIDRLGRKRGTRASQGKAIAFVSSKGGAGATFIASNLAYAVAESGKRRVALIDLNLQFGDAALFLSDQRPPSNLAEVAREIHRLDASLLASAMLQVGDHLSVMAAPDDLAQAADIRREHVAAVIALARANYDAVILDVGRHLDTVSLQALDSADAILPVLQLTLPFIRDARRLLDIFRSLDYPRDKILPIVNRHGKGGEISLRDLENTLASKVFRCIPNSYEAVARSVNLGRAIVAEQPANPVSRALVELGQALLPMPAAAASGGWLSRVFAPRRRGLTTPA